MENQPQSLYTRLGGKDAVTATVVKLYEKVLLDEKLQPFFDGVDIVRIRNSQVAFVTMALGGPHNYTGASLRHAHARLVGQGLTDIHFDAVAHHFSDALHELKVPVALIKEALETIESTRNDVLNR